MRNKKTQHQKKNEVKTKDTTTEANANRIDDIDRGSAFGAQSGRAERASRELRLMLKAAKLARLP